MNKYLTSLLLLIVSVLSTTHVFAAEKYISDDLSTYLRRGPGLQYGLSGSVNAGDKITVIEVSTDGKFTKIQTQAGRIAWIESNALSDTPSLKHLIPELENKIKVQEEALNQAQQVQDNATTALKKQLTTANETIVNLESENQQLQAQVATQQASLESLNNQLDEKRQELILTWFLYGGMVAGGGLILGLILPIIMPRRRKKDRWMI